MRIEEYLLDEMKRLNRLNEQYEKEIIKGTIKSEPEQNIVCNVKAMCNIANSLSELHRTCTI